MLRGLLTVLGILALIAAQTRTVLSTVQVELRFRQADTAAVNRAITSQRLVP